MTTRTIFQVRATKDRATGIRNVRKRDSKDLPVGHVVPIRTKRAHGKDVNAHWLAYIFKAPKSRRDPKPEQIPGEFRTFYDAGAAVWEAREKA